MENNRLISPDDIQKFGFTSEYVRTYMGSEVWYQHYSNFNTKNNQLILSFEYSEDDKKTITLLRSRIILFFNGLNFETKFYTLEDIYKFLEEHNQYLPEELKKTHTKQEHLITPKSLEMIGFVESYGRYTFELGSYKSVEEKRPVLINVVLYKQNDGSLKHTDKFGKETYPQTVWDVVAIISRASVELGKTQLLNQINDSISHNTLYYEK